MPRKKTKSKNKTIGIVGGWNRSSPSQKMADFASRTIGSWVYISIQTLFIFFWVGFNLLGWIRSWDPYPFIFLNLMLSVVATYSAPIILMTQNREAERDRFRAINDLATDRRTERRIIQVKKTLDRIERRLNSQNKK